MYLCGQIANLRLPDYYDDKGNGHNILTPYEENITLTSLCDVTPLYACLVHEEIKKPKKFKGRNNDKTMCTFNVTIDEQKISKMSSFCSREEFGRLLQIYVDKFVDAFVMEDSLSPSPLMESQCTYSETMDLEEARMALHEMVHEVYSQQ